MSTQVNTAALVELNAMDLESSHVVYPKELHESLNICDAIGPEQLTGTAEEKTNYGASSSFDMSESHFFGTHNSIVEKEIDKIFTWHSKRINCKDRKLDSAVPTNSGAQSILDERRHLSFLDILSALKRKLRHSRYYLLMQFILLALPISACCMGKKYEYYCPGSEMTPCLLQVLGVLSIFLILFRIAIVFRKQLSHLSINMLESASFALCWTIAIVLLVEMIPLYNLCPDFDQPLSPNYCHQTFYYYAYYMNIAAMVIGTLALLIHTCIKEIPEIPYVRFS